MNKSILFISFSFSLSLCAMHQPARLYDQGKTESLKLLLDVYSPCYTLPEKEIQQLVLEGADPNACADSGFYRGNSWLVAWRSVKSKSEGPKHSFLAFLLNNGGNPNKKGSTIMSLLMHACGDDDYAAATLLIAAGADVRARSDASKGTTLHFALGDCTRPKLYRTALVKLLLNHGAGPDIELPDNKGESPLGIARKGNFQDIIAIFEASKKSQP